MQTKLSENLREIRVANLQNQRKYIHNWREQLPPGSDWFPGSTGKPGCKICHGLGWFRYDVEYGHPEFGKLHKCDCVK